MKRDSSNLDPVWGDRKYRLRQMQYRTCARRPDEWSACGTLSEPRELRMNEGMNFWDRGIAAVTMGRDIRPLCPEDLPELSRFLAAGFQVGPDADFTTPAVLRWKYLEPLGGNAARVEGERTPVQLSSKEQTDTGDRPPAPLSYVARDESGRIVGHLGLCRTCFRGLGIRSSAGRVSTMHIIDWLGSAEVRSIGISLMRLSHDGAETQFGLGVSPSALAVGERAGYELQRSVPVYSRVLRPRYWLRKAGLGRLERGLRMVRDIATGLSRLPARPRAALTLERVATFDSEIDEIVAKAQSHVILTERNPARLNAFLRFPRQDFSGWHLRDETGRLRGFALLNLVPHDEGRTRTGKIVDCLLDGADAMLWQAAILALTRELRHERADIAQCYASTPWITTALASCGYVSRYGAKFHIRDPDGASSARGDVPSDDARRRLRVHVRFQGIPNKREYPGADA